MLRLLNSYTVLNMAQELAAKRSHGDQTIRDKVARNLVLTEDFALMSALAKHAREAIGHYDEAALAALVSDKRIRISSVP